jgi:hypothetical protein
MFVKACTTFLVANEIVIPMTTVTTVKAVINSVVNRTYFTYSITLENNTLLNILS